MTTWPRWMCRDTCARYIDRTPQAVEALVKRGRIPSTLVGNRRVFGRDEIDRWVHSGGVLVGHSPHIMEGSR